MQEKNWYAISSNQFFIIFINCGRFKAPATVKGLNVTKERVRQFPEDLYSNDDVLLCKICGHSIDYVKVDIINDH